MSSAAEGERMRLQVKGKNLDVSDSIRTYAEDKLRKLERQLADPTQIELELSIERNPSISANHVAEATIWTKGPTLRAREASADMRASIDQLVDKLERQGQRHPPKRPRRARRGNGTHPAARPPAGAGAGGAGSGGWRRGGGGGAAAAGGAGGRGGGGGGFAAPRAASPRGGGGGGGPPRAPRGAAGGDRPPPPYRARGVRRHGDVW